MARRIQIFRAGSHTDMRGATHSFSEADLVASAAAYDPGLHEAPLVVGHPQHDAPAYGWVGKLDCSEGALEAEPSHVDAQFAELVRARRFGKVSASFYRPDYPGNPKPGVWYLRHVGFLGAAPPAVKGLRQVEFAGEEDGSVTLEFSEQTERTSARLMRSLREWMLAKFGQEDADKALPSWDVDSLQEAAAQPLVPAAASTGFSESDAPGSRVDSASETPQVAPNTATPEPPAAEYAEPERPVGDPPADGDEREAALRAREAELASREAAFRERELGSRRAEHGTFLDELVRSGRPLPCSKELCVSFMRLLDGEESGAVSFGEGEQRTPLELFRSELLAHLPKQVEFGELARSDGELGADDPQAIAAAATEYAEEQRARGRHVSTSEAVTHVMKRGA